MYKQSLRSGDLQKGFAHLLLLLAGVGLLGFFAVISFVPFRNNLFSSIFPKPASQAASNGDWPMSGANPQRTSWTSAEAPGQLKVEWVKPIEPYISQKTQVIAANKTIFIATAKGLYAFNSDDASEKWVFPTELPLGNAPTYDNGTVYVGGLDRKLYAFDANTGVKKWEFIADGGFSTNPLVINNTVYLGNRDSYFYAVDAVNGSLQWKYKTGGPILFSAAYNTGTIYFASQDASAYALNENPSNPNDPNTILKWKSAKLPGYGFHSWWPVIYQDKVIFTGSVEEGANPRVDSWLYPTSYKVPIDTTSFPPAQLPGVKGTEPGNWPAGQATYDIRTNPAGKSLPDYYEGYPKKRRAYILNQNSGSEVQYDLDNDGITDAAPFTPIGQKSGNMYPPAVGSDGVLYFQTINHYSGAIPGAKPVGWKIGTPFLSLPVSTINSAGMSGYSAYFPQDEPIGTSIGGNILYWNLCCDRYIGSANLSIPNSYPIPPINTMDPGTRQWRHTSGDNPPPMGSGFFPKNYYQQNLAYIWDPNPTGNILRHIESEDIVGPTIYDGKMFVLRSNALFAFSPTGLGNTAPVLSLAATQAAQSTPLPLTTNQLKTRLEDQIQKMISTGHLRSGISKSGIVDQFIENPNVFGEDKLMHYWHSPGENISILLRVLPHLSPALQTQLKAYIQNEQTLFPLQTTMHIGFTSGAPREAFDLRQPPNTVGSQSNSAMGPIGGRNWDNYYALWKYAQVFGNAKQLFDSIKIYALPTVPADTDLPNKINNYITGLTGYLELQKLAGYAEDPTKAADLARLKNIRAQQLKWDVTGGRSSTFENNYYSVLISAWNFLHMMPEMADYMNQNALAKAQSVIAKYESMAPYWMQSENEDAQLENNIMPYYQQYTLFQAKAKILKQPQSELVKYLDEPITPVGDLYYIDNLVAAIEAPVNPNQPTPPPSLNPTAVPTPGKVGDINNSGTVDIFDYNQLLTDFGKKNDSVTKSDLDNDDDVDIFDYNFLLSNFGQ